MNTPNTEQDATLDTDKLIATLQQLMEAIKQGALYHGELFNAFQIKYKLATKAPERRKLEIAMAETAGGAVALQAVFNLFVNPDTVKPETLQQVFSGKGLSYPKLMKQGKQIYIPGGNN